ncbi:MAG: putative DNA modification/repair radical SAM protein [Thermotogae bacterium]|nr:putative DNA modification/repair radical SAM protein [Thermotogota bacterium]
MEVIEKLNILSGAAKYDVSCSSSGVERKGGNNSVGNTSSSGICHSWSSDGRCISLLKILYSNDCIFDCAYCINRKSNDVKRASFTPAEITELTIGFYKRNYIEGLFLSSAIIKNPDHTMEMMLKVVKTLRTVHRFNGYIHLKAIPGADAKLLREAGFYADRMSVNIELPSEESLKKLAPQKNKKSILLPMKNLGDGALEICQDKKKFRNTPSFIPAGQSTQLIVGASPENDFTIMKLSDNLYKSYSLKRVYYSAFVKVNEDNRLPDKNEKMVREHRLYQADWLIRVYNFNVNELFENSKKFLDYDIDPKSFWALNNLNYFPIEINSADYDTLIRIPGIGIKSALRIIGARKYSVLDFENLKSFGVVLKRAKYFITCKGKYYGFIYKDAGDLKNMIKDKKNGLFIKLPYEKNLPEVYGNDNYL